MWIAWSKRLEPFVKLMSKNSIAGESLLCLFLPVYDTSQACTCTDTRKTWSHAQAQKLPCLIQILKEHKPHAGGRQRDSGHRVWTPLWSVFVFFKISEKNTSYLLFLPSLSFAESFYAQKLWTNIIKGKYCAYTVSLSLFIHCIKLENKTFTVYF